MKGEAKYGGSFAALRMTGKRAGNDRGKYNSRFFASLRMEERRAQQVPCGNDSKKSEGGGRSQMRMGMRM